MGYQGHLRVDKEGAQIQLERNNFEIIGSSLGVHWPDVDENISASGRLYGISARPRKAVVAPV